MSMSITLRRVRAELRRRPQGARHLRPAPPARSTRAFWRMLLGDPPLPEGGAAAARRRAGQRPDLRRVPRPARLRPSTSSPTTPCRSSPACGRWATARRWTTRRRTSSRSSHHHGFLVLGDAPTWHTVVGGSRSYVGAITARLDVVRTRTRVTAVSRKPDARRDRRRARRPPRLRQGRHRHPRRRRAGACSPTPARTSSALLGAFGYSTQRGPPAPRRDRAAGAPHAAGPAGTTGSRAATTVTDRSQVSYWMNRLQGHPESDPLVVTLNPDERRRRRPTSSPTMTYLHPTYTAASVAAQDAAGRPEHRPARVRRRLPRLGLPRGRLPLGRRRRRGAGSDLVSAAPPRRPRPTCRARQPPPHPAVHLRVRAPHHHVAGRRGTTPTRPSRAGCARSRRSGREDHFAADDRRPLARKVRGYLDAQRPAAGPRTGC